MADEVKGTAPAEQESTTDTEKVESQPTADKQERTFTQADLDKVIAERLARQRAQLPTDDEVKGYREWKKAQQTEAEKAAEREAELAKHKADSETLRRENLALKAGVRAAEVDYVLFKVGKLEGEFEGNLKTFLEENKKFTEPQTVTVGGTQHKPSQSSLPEDAIVNAARKAAGLNT